jgi:hypothetical protein
MKFSLPSSYCGLFLLLLLVSSPILLSYASPEDDDDNNNKKQHDEKGEGYAEASGSSIDAATANAIREQVDASCAVEVDEFLQGKLEQGSMTQDCQKELLEAYRKTPIGQLVTREQQVLQKASFLRVSSKCQNEFKGAQAETDVSPECHEKMQKEFNGLQRYVFQQTVTGFSETCKAEFQELQKKPGATGKDISAPCLVEMQSLKPAVLDIIEKQIERQQNEQENGGANSNDNNADSSSSSSSMNKGSPQEQQEAAAKARREKKRRQEQQDSEASDFVDADDVVPVRSSSWGIKDYLFILIWLIAPTSAIAYVYNKNRHEVNTKNKIEAKLENLTEEQREKKYKILMRKEKKKQERLNMIERNKKE